METIESFEKIAEKLNMVFTTSASLEDKLSVLKESKNELSTIVKNENKLITLEDKNYLIEKTKELIEHNLDVLQILKKTIKIGTAAREFEVYAKVSDSITNSIRELRELNKMLFDITILHDGFGSMEKEKDDGKISMTSSQLLNMINIAKKDNQLISIDAEFKVLEDVQGK